MPLTRYDRFARSIRGVASFASNDSKTILIVCTGNVCRSPMAEVLLQHMTRDKSDLRVMSAGLGALDGMPASDHAVEAVSEKGLDLTRFRSSMLRADRCNGPISFSGVGTRSGVICCGPIEGIPWH